MLVRPHDFPHLSHQLQSPLNIDFHADLMSQSLNPYLSLRPEVISICGGLQLVKRLHNTKEDPLVNAQIQTRPIGSGETFVKSPRNF